MASWTLAAPGIWRFRDSCNVWGIEGPDGLLVVNAGTGDWLETRPPAPIVALVCTHYFRDHSAGAAAAARTGIPVLAPEYEAEVFTDPEQHFRQRETYIVYDNLWDLYAPIAPIPIRGVLRDYETLNLAGLTVEVLPLPGATLTQIGLGVTLPDGRRVAVCGEAIHSPGRIPRVAPLQYNYNDLNGALQCEVSVRTLRAWKPDILLPSLGAMMAADTDGALAALQANLRRMAAPRPGLRDEFERLDAEPLTRITDRVWLDNHSVANTWYILSDSGKALAIDYGYARHTCAAWSGYPKPERRRALLHGVDALKARFGIDRIDTVLVSHFHDDHVCGIPVLQRLFGTQCWAAENFADLLEMPSAHCFPCNWPVAARIDRRLPMGTTFTWEDITFHLHPMSGHTRFSALIGFEVDGKRFAHTGDQYFFDGHEDFARRNRAQNHVYRNGALLGGYAQSGAWMQAWRPEIVLQGHQPAFVTDDAFFGHIDAWNEDYAALHRALTPLADEDTHFDLDAWGGWIWPYRTHLVEPGSFTVTVTVRNPLPRRAPLSVRLVVGDREASAPAFAMAAPHAEIAFSMSLTVDTFGRRQPFAVELTVDGQPFGQVAEALVTVGGDHF